MESKLEDLVKRHIEEKRKSDESALVNFEERRIWWQKKVHELLSDIKTWIDPLIKSNTIQFTQETRKLNEEHIGEYEIASAKINVGKEALVIDPKGTLIIGAYGRVDVTGPNGRVLLLLIPSDENAPSTERRKSSTWYICDPKNKKNLYQFEQKSFEMMFTDLFGISK